MNGLKNYYQIKQSCKLILTRNRIAIGPIFIITAKPPIITKVKADRIHQFFHLVDNDENSLDLIQEFNLGRENRQMVKT